MALHANDDETGPASVTRRVVNLTMLHLEKWRSGLNKTIHHLLQLWRVASKGYWCEENRYVTSDDSFGDFTTGICFHTDARRLDPAVEASEAVGQFDFGQMKSFYLSAISFEHRGQAFEHGQQSRVTRGRAIENYDIGVWHAGRITAKSSKASASGHRQVITNIDDIPGNP